MYTTKFTPSGRKEDGQECTLAKTGMELESRTGINMEQVTTCKDIRNSTKNEKQKQGK